MKSLLFLLVIVCLPISMIAQNQNEIYFQKELTWDQIKLKAKAENRYIFVDCYATWCGPCKFMDRDVFTNDRVAQFFNTNFISIKVQIDSTSTDDLNVKSWYVDAHSIQRQYKIVSLPTYLFFDPAGNLVHKGIGALRDTSFIKLAANSLNPEKQFYGLLNNYLKGGMQFNKMPFLISQALYLGEKDMADKIAEDYKFNYFDKLTKEELSSKENLEFIVKFYQLVSSKDKFFDLIYQDGQKVDSIMMSSDKRYAGYSDRFVRAIINKEEIDNKLWKNMKPISMAPNWKKIEKNICKKYSCDYAKVLLPDAELSFYAKVENWEKYVKVFEQKIKMNPPKIGGNAFGKTFGDAWELNSTAWNLFLNCTDRKILFKALEWSNQSIQLEEPKPNIQYFDTKANLLYKLGFVKDAINCEQNAIRIDNERARKNGKEHGSYFQEYNATINKMERLEPTWKDKHK